LKGGSTVAKTFFGVHVPTVTPFDYKGDVDYAKISELTEFYVDNGVCCLVPTANNGEQPHLSEIEKKRVWEETVKVAGGTVAVVPSITGNTTKGVVELAKHAKSIGADGVMVGAPYYFQLDDEELFEHYRAVAEAVDIPVMIHNEPEIFKVDVKPYLVAKLNEIGNIGLIKESTYVTQRVHEIVRLCGDRMTVVVAGSGTALESMLLGAKGWMTGLINFMPGIAAEIYRLAVIEEKYAEAKRLYFRKILPVYTCMKEIGRPVSVVKYAMELVGVSVGETRKPLKAIQNSEKKRIKKVLQDIELVGR
jgi:4-hydroxy-tetrahydrodipicolinate synthase